MWDPDVYLTFADHRGRPFLALLSHAELLIGAGRTVDAWQTTYEHQLSGEHSMLDWISGTALRAAQ